MMDILPIIGRDQPLFSEDIGKHETDIYNRVLDSRFLVIGGAGSIGGAVVRELFERRPRLLHVVDVSENNLAELVRSLRSSTGYIEGEFKTFCLDCTGPEFDAMLAEQDGYDYVLNFSALKHVRSEKDPFTLMRMINVNIFGTENTLRKAFEAGASKYFCVSTDKASNPVNMMGASKRIMEMFLLRGSEGIDVSSARFANVAFSDGSLPYSWTQRIRRRQPLVAPNDVKRYFVTDQEGALLCLLSAFFGRNRDIFFPKLSEKLHLITFSSMAERFLESLSYEPHICGSEDEARGRADELIAAGKWPCYFFASDTTGEKDFEEFYTDEEKVDWDRFHDIGVVQNDLSIDRGELEDFANAIRSLREKRRWTKAQLVELFNDALSTFKHKETFRYLDDRM